MRRSIAVALVALSTVAAAAGAARATPRGRLVFISPDGHRARVVTESPDGADRTLVFATRRSLSYTRWSPDGTAIAFIVFRRGHHDRIDAVAPDGTDRRVLVARPRLPAAWGAIGSFAWSPDGTQLAVCLHDQATYKRTRTYVALIGGTGLTLVARGVCVQDWSSTGLLLASHGADLVSLAPDGTGERVLFHGNAWYARWSPDASRVAFVSGVDVLHPDIWTVGAGGRHLTRLTRSRRVDVMPAWSPNGASIAWVRARPLSYHHADLWTMRADGSHKAPIARTRLDEFYPDWTGG